ncbi:contact-dependent growth inhibition system immunity protein [Umezawaea beigongshangensis]|uniref:contact-dependent growth inhibition system immunity protein n=1 Tax=Umezawaea beigongshangensis TaxID=2780383 RepID=UPI0018F112F4|nr:contact-dependent growth inhibition system immunity protein [Umezawaea beigongshangensis]
MTTSTDRRRSVEDIEGDRWGDPPADATYLIRTVLLLRRTPVGELGVEDLRILLGQRVAPSVLVPLALEVLLEDPLAAGHFYPGDLLKSVLGQPGSFWDGHPGPLADLTVVLDRFQAVLEAADPDEVPPRDLLRAVREFRER